jgi:hypothetical protein
VIAAQPVDIDDMVQLLDLIKEYTGKLRAVCEERVADKYRMWTMATMMVTVFVTLIGAVAALAFKGSELRTESLLPITIAAIGTSMATMFGMTMVLSRQRNRTSFDARYLFTTVERLVMTASQYSEHASRRLSDKFMFDLRLAEAEAVLHMYKDLCMSYPEIRAIEAEFRKKPMEHHKVSAGITGLAANQK